MISTNTQLAIRQIEFINSTIMFVHLNNDRTFIVPLDQFPAIKKLTVQQRSDFEIIDGSHLSFLDIDEVFSLEELIGL
jgi:Protein of unknown function (DUF2442)